MKKATRSPISKGTKTLPCPMTHAQQSQPYRIVLPTKDCVHGTVQLDPFAEEADQTEIDIL